MYRNKTVREMMRGWERDREALMRMIDTLLDRNMHLTGKPWGVAPADVPPVEPVERKNRVEYDLDYGPESVDAEVRGLLNRG